MICGALTQSIALRWNSRNMLACMRLHRSLSPGMVFGVDVFKQALFFFGCNVYPSCYLRGEHIVCPRALMRINQREGDWERSNLSFLALGFPFFFLFVIGASGFREEKRVWKKKGDEKQNNTIRMLLDSFVLVVDFFFFFPFSS